MTNTEVMKSEHSQLSLTLSSDTFVNMILNFLGKKQKLGYSEDLIFILERNDIEQFHYLLDAKLEREHIKIDHFMVNFSFNDNTIREISGIDNLTKYLETRDVYPSNVIMTWNIIIKFPNSETIETQTIELAFIVNDQDQLGSIGKVILLINCTNLSWGNEVLDLFIRQIKSVKKIESLACKRARNLLGVSSNCKKDEKSLKLMLYLLSFMIGIFAAFLLTIFFNEKLVMDYRSANYLNVADHVIKNQLTAENAATIIAINQLSKKDTSEFASNLILDSKLKDILNSSLEFHEKRENFLIFITAVMFFPVFALLIMRIYFKDVLRYHKMNSYILTTQKCINLQAADLENKNSIKHYSISVITVGILISAAGSLLYALFFN